MSSYLAKQSNAFRGTLASAAAKISNPSTVKASLAAPSLAPPSPSPSAASDPNTPSSKRKRDAGPEVPFSQPELTGFGEGVKTQMTFAVDLLKKKGEPKTIQEIIDHLSLQNYAPEHKQQLAEGLRFHNRVDWRPDSSLSEQTWETGKYSYKPVIIGVRDATSLLAHLQRMTDAAGVSVKDLKDGWPDCEAAISDLEAKHKILVVRTKKDNLPRYVWPDDPSLHYQVQDEFRIMWTRVPIPSIDDMHRKLVSVGQKPTSEDPSKINQGQGAKPKAQRKRAGKRMGKATNVHMAHLMQDYSGMRR
ncbi:hypothetical protein B0T10DRAFT_480376 [Thelonectria olida]|uniref:Transcription initiation factor IIE subunit beta n=1 Tax=Thelonectria olida TaxID=1576542 RepID=A0A9P8W9Y3_9HYPO|nr:hypothetical protein B0T10DRAFT_480376 [Thelonectria olida]